MCATGAPDRATTRATRADARDGARARGSPADREPEKRRDDASAVAHAARGRSMARGTESGKSRHADPQQQQQRRRVRARRRSTEARVRRSTGTMRSGRSRVQVQAQVQPAAVRRGTRRTPAPVLRPSGRARTRARRGRRRCPCTVARRCTQMRKTRGYDTQRAWSSANANASAGACASARAYAHADTEIGEARVRSSTSTARVMCVVVQVRARARWRCRRTAVWDAGRSAATAEADGTPTAAW